MRQKINDIIRHYMRIKPQILNQKIVHQSRIFSIEEVDLKFSNGVKRTYERITSHGKSSGAVMVVPLIDNENVLLVEEYCVGVEKYQISLPKGLIELNEDVLDAANRELKEEAGFGAKKLEYITSLSLSPSYMSQSIHVVLATDLFQEKLEGDEPEHLALKKVNLNKLFDLVKSPMFSEGRALAALFLVRELLLEREIFQAKSREI